MRRRIGDIAMIGWMISAIMLAVPILVALTAAFVFFIAWSFELVGRLPWPPGFGP